MKIYNTFILTKSKDNTSFLLIPRHFISDIDDIIQEFNESNIEIKSGLVYMDLQSIVGNRKKKYVSYDIFNYKIKRKSKKLFNHIRIINEIQDLKSMYSKKSDHNMLDYLLFQGIEF